jgi:very-short-patch-repair endonuclease
MEPYQKTLKEPSRSLRKSMTSAEQFLWHRLRRKQIRGVQFYRQKTLLSFIVDFYCPVAKLVIELDGSQHNELEHKEQDAFRDAMLAELNLRVLRFSNQEVVRNIDAVVAVIEAAVVEQE